MHLEPGSLIRDQCVGRGVRLVKTVAGKVLHQVKQPDRHLGVVAFFNRTLFEQGAMFSHFFGFFLTHRATQQIGASQRVATDNLRDQHHLLLIHDHAVSTFQCVFKIGMEIIDGGATMLTIDEVIHHPRFKRAGTKQRQHSDHVFKRIRAQFFEQFFHATRFQLEHRGGIGLG